MTVVWGVLLVIAFALYMLVRWLLITVAYQLADRLLPTE